MLGYSDVPVTIPPDARSFYGCIEAKYVTKYLEDYIDSHIYNGSSLRSRIHYGQNVENIEKRNDIWVATTRHFEQGLREFRGSKLVVATGLTSLPYMPAFLQQPGSFKSPICHHKQFGEISKTLLRTSECKNVAVFGAGKSATDMVYESVKKGKNVSWIIRKDGEGPAFFFTAPGRGSPFWCTGPLGLALHDDFWDTLAHNVYVYRNDIRSMKANSIVLDDGSEIAADVLLCGTGWSAQYPFFSKQQACELGLPHRPEDDPPDESRLWSALLKQAEQRVLSDFPILQHPPPHNAPDGPTTTLRMYNCIASLNDPSVVFLGRAHLSNSFRTSEAQAIWATAYFDGNVKMPPRAQAQRDIAYMNALSKKRYPSHGAVGDYLFFELVWYTDRLMDEVGLKSHRKGWLTDWVEPCLAADFKDVKKEYLEKYHS
ncbi:MAG: hypothetical protein Q9179_000371 [Wetmoreana sp. 5 TL-2023]